MKAALASFADSDSLLGQGYGKSYGNYSDPAVEAPVYMPCRPVFMLGCCLSGAPNSARRASKE
jgi:hypothetical protein